MWTKFQNILEFWRSGGWINGKWYPGLGIEGFGKNGEFLWKQDEARNRYVWLKNADGGGSMAFLRSMIHGEHIASRVKSMEFTTFFFDELSDTDDEDYFTKPIQQLYRIPGVKPQQFIGACNPPVEGEDHWTHKRFFRGFDDPKERMPKKRKDYAVFHVPITDNQFVDEEQKQATLANIQEEMRVDPTAYDRLILGKWVKRPTGKGLFAKFFRRPTHVHGDLKSRRFIIPRGNIIDIGYDPGTANTAISFNERHYTRKGELWTAFDEIVLVGQYVALPEVVVKLLVQMDYWCERTGRTLHFNHISDSGAFDQMRPDGSYDARKIEELAQKELTDHAARYPRLAHLRRRIRLVPCPKPNGSVASRVRMMIGLLQTEMFAVSARCPRLIEMFENMEEDPDRPYQPRKESRYKHAFDALSYPIYHYEMGGRSAGPLTEGETKLVELHV
jgi:hypothetical protein